MADPSAVLPGGRTRGCGRPQHVPGALGIVRQTDHPASEAASYSTPQHNTLVIVDVEGFGRRCRTNPNKVSIRRGMYRAVQRAFAAAGVDWAECRYSDLGDGVLILAPTRIPKVLFADLLPGSLAAELVTRNATRQPEQRIRLRLALHAGEVSYDDPSEVHRLVEGGRGVVEPSRSPRVPAVVDQGLEARVVEVVVLGQELVAGVLGDDPRGDAGVAEGGAQPADVGLEVFPGVVGWVVVLEGFGECAGGDDLAVVEHQHTREGAFLRAPERDRPVAELELHGPQDPGLHPSPGGSARTSRPERQPGGTGCFGAGQPAVKVLSSDRQPNCQPPPFTIVSCRGVGAGGAADRRNPSRIPCTTRYWHW
ncbi:hypothetical protein ACIRSS_23040 [Amycolatopsis sp. NPDC101161]|uniref:hypothetical protein n=1 Tax=Amycolatopsis sp. NPDC101161 TaxID=3363940 RepID=UPI003811BAAC